MYNTSFDPMIHGAILLAVSYFLFSWWYKRDELVEDRRREAIKLVGKLNEAGQTWLADFITDYAVGDYDELGVKIAKLIQLSKSDEAMKSTLRSMALSVLMGGLEDEVTRKAIAEKLEPYGKLVGDTPEPVHVPFMNPKVAAALKAAAEVLKNAEAVGVAVAPEAKAAVVAANAAVGISTAD